jgi:cholesterol oxidase
VIAMLDVIVIGSGHGGAVMAARLAPAARVLVLERGRQWSAARFPTGLASFARTYRSRRNPLGLWDVRFGEGIAVGAVSGVGGASLLYYGITTQPDDHALADWPVSAAALAPYFARARAVLRPDGDPAGDRAGDRAFLDRVEPGQRRDLANTIDWTRCTRCGDCVLGCPHDAKRTLDLTYLALARAAGATIRAEAEVVGLCRMPIGWTVLVRPTGGGPLEALAARHVVVAAGTLGTLELLQPLRDELGLSPAFGRDLSMNGDGAAFLHATHWRVGGDDGTPVTTSVRLIDHSGDRPRTLTVMSGRVPRFLMHAAAAGLHLAAPLLGERLGRGRDRAAGGSALARTFMYKLDGQDAGRGQVRFDHGRAVLDWPDYADDPILRFAGARLRAWAAEVGGTMLRDLGTWPGMRSFGVHPLGGCRMAARWDDGVVDDRGRVHDHAGGLVDGLHVLDGSVLPTSLGVPPSLTIAALAERAAELLAAELATAPARAA